MEWKSGIRRLLTKGSEKIGSDLTYIAQGGTWLALAQSIASLAAFVVTVFLTHVFTKEEYGVYRFLLTLVPFFAVANLPGMMAAITRSVAKGNFVSLSRILFVRIQYGTLGTLISLFLGGYYLLMGNIDLALSLLAVAVLIPFYETFSAYIAYIHGQERFDRSAIHTAITRIVVAVLTIAIAFLTVSPLLTVLTFVATAALIQSLFAQRIIREHNRSQKRHPLPDDTENVIRYGTHLSGVNVITTINNHIDKLLIWYIFGPVVLASYAIARSVPEQGTRLLNLIPQLALPKFSRRHWSHTIEQHTFFRKLFVLVVCLIFLALLYVLGVWILFPVLFPTYPEVILPAIIIAPLIVLIPIKGMLGQILLSEELKKDMVFASFGELCAYLIAFIIVVYTGYSVLAGLVLSFITKIGVHIIFQLHAITRMKQ